MARPDDKFMLRLPDGMRDRIAEIAKANGRSMNAEIVRRLEWSFEAPLDKKADGEIRPISAAEMRRIADMIEELTARMDKVFGPIAEARRAKKERSS